jgi:hypothetical protein
MRCRAATTLVALGAAAVVALLASTQLRPRAPPAPLATRAASCVPDFRACAGGVLSPVRAKCCNPESTCFRRGRYFSQCRPRASATTLDGAALESSVAGGEFLRGRSVVSAELCAPDYGVCSAGADASSALPCCSKRTFHCVRASPLFYQCLPERGGSKHHWSAAVWSEREVGYAWHAVLPSRKRFAYVSDVDVARLEHYVDEPVSPEAKIAQLSSSLRLRAVEQQGGGSFGGTLCSALPSKLPAGLGGLLRDALPDEADFFANPGEIVVNVLPSSGGAALWDAAMVLASFPFVRDVRLV